MGYIALPRRLFLWSMALIYMSAFVSLYVQIPGLYGDDGLLPAWRQLRSGRPGGSLWERVQARPTLLWLAPGLGLSVHSAMELLCVGGAVLSLGAALLEVLRDSLVFLLLWLLYLSLQQVGQVFLYFQWDSLLLETGFLCVLVAPLGLLRGGSRVREHDPVTFWLLRWLLFRLMFASGVVKLTSRCPTWWGLTALTYHYETQCIPSSLAWAAHQLPVWWQRLSVVGTFVIEIPVPFLFFSPIRRLRLGAFYLQVLLQILIILSGNYNFFNLLTLSLCLSLLDDRHVHFLLRRPRPPHGAQQGAGLRSWLCLLVELSVWAGLICAAIVCFDLQVDWAARRVSSRTAFTFHHFNQFLKNAIIPSIWLGLLSLSWEMFSAMFRCACVQGFWRRFCSTLQWTLVCAAAVSMFTLSLVPFSYVEPDSAERLWPGVRRAHRAVDRLQLASSYGLFRRMTGVGGRPEVVLEGSMDQVTWTEIDFMYKPGNLSRAPPLVAPHQPRLDWQMWFVALGPPAQDPWFSSLVQRLLQGSRDVEALVQADGSQYPFHTQPPAFLRAQRYKYWFTGPKEDGTFPQRWWQRVWVEEFYPAVQLGDSFLEARLQQHGLKDRPPPCRGPGVRRALRWLRSQVSALSAPAVTWSLLACSAAVWLLSALRGAESGVTDKVVTSGEAPPPEEGEVDKDKPEDSEEEDKNDSGDEELTEEEEQEQEEEEEQCEHDPRKEEDPGMRRRK